MKSHILVYCSLLLLGFSCKEPQKVVPSEITEKYRPQYHFTPEEKWMNDPNGLVYYDGFYHLFYQYYPDSTVWGPMHWGHAKSVDLLNWTHQPIALFPDSLGYIFSGSAVIDQNNTSKLQGQNSHPPMVAIFTHHNSKMEEERKSDLFQYQSIAYSLDGGKTFEKYENNPVVKNPGIRDFRDPKVIWHEPTQKWVMVLAAYDKAIFYTSPNLIDWQRSGEFGIKGDHRLWECPDLFPIQVEGTNEEKWVLITSIQKDAPNGGTATSYFVGEFDGKTFIGNPKEQKWLDYGTDNYAFVTFSNVQNRILGIGWMSNWQYAQVVPTKSWRSAMTLPRELKLIKNIDEYLIKTLPVSEINGIISNQREVELSKTKGKIEINGSNKVFGLFSSNVQEKITLKFSNNLDQYTELTIDPQTKTITIDRTKSGVVSFNENFPAIHSAPILGNASDIKFEIYLDHSSMEVFINDGLTCMTDIFFPDKPYDILEIKSGDALKNIQIADIKALNFKTHQ